LGTGCERGEVGPTGTGFGVSCDQSSMSSSEKRRPTRCLEEDRWRRDMLASAADRLMQREHGVGSMLIDFITSRIRKTDAEALKLKR
jgi:hypothetical protein